MQNKFLSASTRYYEYYTFIMHHPFMKKMMRGWNVNPSLSDCDDTVYHRMTVPNNAMFR